MQHCTVRHRRRSCSRPATSSGPIAVVDRPASAAGEFLPRVKPRRFWKACRQCFQSTRSSCRPATSEAAWHSWADRSVAVARSRPLCCATGCLRDRKRKPPNGHPARRQHIRLKCPRERARTGPISRRSASTRPRTSGRLRRASCRLCWEVGRSTTEDWKSVEWAGVRSEANYPFAAGPKFVRATRRRSTSRRPSICRSSPNQAVCSNREASDASLYRPP